VFGEFVPFLRKTNALAVAVSIGGAIGKVVTSVVNDLLPPVIDQWLGGGDWRAWQIVLKAAPDGKVLSAIGVGSSSGRWWTSSSSPSSCSSSERRS
jgi:large-conductance mechanosensitive channel